MKYIDDRRSILHGQWNNSSSIIIDSILSIYIKIHNENKITRVCAYHDETSTLPGHTEDLCEQLWEWDRDRIPPF